jgi:hypothetical protein
MASLSSFWSAVAPPRVPVAAVALCWLAVCGSVGAPQTLTPGVAAPPHAPVSVSPPPSPPSAQGVAQVQDLLQSLARFDQKGRPADQKLGFEIPEKTFNDYLAWSLLRNPRPGIGTASVSLVSKNEIAVNMEVDFDVVGDWSGDLIPPALRPMLKGKMPLQLTAQFQSQNGVATFTLKDARGQEGRPIVSKVMMNVLQAIGGHQPESFETSKPIPLPFGLKRIWIDQRSVCGET